MMLRKFIAAAILIFFVFTGCAPAVLIGGAALGAGGYKYYDGALVVIYKAPFDKTWDASIKALENLGYPVYERKRKIASGKIITTGPVKERIKLSVKYSSLEKTEVNIRVGIMGDEEISAKVKDEIGSILFNIKSGEPE